MQTHFTLHTLSWIITVAIAHSKHNLHMRQTHCNTGPSKTRTKEEGVEDVEDVAIRGSWW